MKEIYFVTGNAGKVASANKNLNEYGINVNIANFDIVEPEVNDIKYIAKRKVELAYSKLNKPCIANDSGFYIESYPGIENFPGAFVNRKLLIPIGVVGLLNIMSNVKNRNCYFEDCVAYYDGCNYKFFHSISRGTLSKTLKGLDRCEAWSPLWHVFIPEGYDKTLAEMSNDERKIRSEKEDSSLKQFAKWYSGVYEKRLIK